MTDAELERRLTLWALAGGRCESCDEKRADPDYIVPFSGVWDYASERDTEGWIVCGGCRLWKYTDFGETLKDVDEWIDQWIKRHAAGAATSAPRE